MPPGNHQRLPSGKAFSSLYLQLEFDIATAAEVLFIRPYSLVNVKPELSDNRTRKARATVIEEDRLSSSFVQAYMA